jgi:hypothetical protein
MRRNSRWSAINYTIARSCSEVGNTCKGPEHGTRWHAEGMAGVRDRWSREGAVIRRRNSR